MSRGYKVPTVRPVSNCASTVRLMAVALAKIETTLLKNWINSPKTRESIKEMSRSEKTIKLLITESHCPCANGYLKARTRKEPIWPVLKNAKFRCFRDYIYKRQTFYEKHVIF